MKTLLRGILGLCMALLLLLPMTSHAGEAVKLALKFREGQILRYTYTEALTYLPPSKFAGATGYNLEVKVEYSIKVNQVTEDRVATVRLTFERLTVLKDGTQIADLTVFPKEGTDVSGTIRPNGETSFYKNFYLAVNRGGQLEYRISNGGGVMATGTTAETSEKYFLETDLSEQEGVIKIGLPPTRTLESPEQARLAEFKVDLSPRKLLTFLTLPTVPLAVGQTFTNPIKYLCTEKLSYVGKADEAGYEGSQVAAEISPWTGDTSHDTGLQPAVSGNITYLIDSLGKLVKVKGKLHTEIVIPDVGPQQADTRLELVLRK